MKFVRVEHWPVERKDWQRRRGITLVAAVGCLIALLGYSLLLYLIFPPQGGDEGRVTIYLVFVVVFFFNMLVCFSVNAKLGKGPDDADTFFFRSATVEVDAPVETIFAECLRALKQLDAYALEFDAKGPYLEATLVMSLNSFSGTSVDGALAVTVYDSTNAPLDMAVNATCKNGVAHTTGSTEEHQAGQVYLSIDASGDWTL